MLQDKAYNNIKYFFQTQSNLEKFNELATVLQKNGIHNWDEGLQYKNESDLVDLGIDQKYAHIFVSEVKRQNQQNNDMSDFSDIASMASYATSNYPRKFQSQDKANQQFYTEEKIERELSKIYDVWQEVNDEFFNQFPDLTRIIFLNFIAQEKMIIYGGIHSSNVEELFRAFSKFVDYKKLTHFITSNTNVEELFDKSGLNALPTTDLKQMQNTQTIDLKLNEANFLLLHQIFQASSPLINAIIRHLSENDKLTTYATTEQDQPSMKQFDSQILEEFLFTYFDEAEKQVDEKKDNFDEFVQAMWTKNGQNGKIVAPQKFMKGGPENSKLNGINARIPNAFKKPTLKLTQEFLTALGELAFQKVEDSTGILKLYLKELRERLLDNKILISQRKWMRIFRVLKIVAYTRNIGDTSRISLADCFIVPLLMAKGKSEYKLIEKINLEVIENLARFYGSLKLSHYLEKHFWLLSTHKTFIKQIKRRHSHLPSFFQGCISHPDYFQIYPEILQQQKYSQLCYSVSGSDRKMLSDDFFAIDPNKAYEMKLDIKTSHRMIVYIGLVCFDENKEFIHSTQVCRVEDSEVIIAGDDEQTNSIIVTSESEQNLKKWNVFNPDQKEKQKNFAYLRSMGFYQDGDNYKLIPISHVIQDNVKPYDTSDEHGAYSVIKGNKIHLTEYGWRKYQQLKEKGAIQFNKTSIMNHFEGGTYTFAECFDDHIKKWMQKTFWFKGETRSTETNKFRKGTKYVKIVILSNYNSGFPDFKILHKDASIMWKNIEFNYLK